MARLLSGGNQWVQKLSFSRILFSLLCVCHSFCFMPRSLRFGFVEFESEEKCRAAKEAMEDCEIDGCQVNVDHALSHVKKHPQAGREGPAKGKPAEQGAAKGSNTAKKVTVWVTQHITSGYSCVIMFF